MPIGQRLRLAFDQTPWTMGVILANLLVWLPAFFGYPFLMQTLAGKLDVAHAWRWITFPLSTPAIPLWLLLGLFCFYLFAHQLERLWGSLRYGRVILCTTILVAASQWLGAAMVAKSMQPDVSVAGFTYLAGCLFMMWASLNREAELRLFFVIPIPAKYLALVAVILVFLSPMGPLFSAPLALLYAGCWKWAGQGTPGQFSRSKASGSGVGKWWAGRKKAQRLNRFQVLEGGTPLSNPPSRVGSLKSLSKTPAPKDQEPPQKELDRILDKIRFEGMSALTDGEKKTLDSQSRRLRGDE